MQAGLTSLLFAGRFAPLVDDVQAALTSNRGTRYRRLIIGQTQRALSILHARYCDTETAVV